MWCRPDARLRHYQFCIFRSSHSDTRLAPVFLFLHFSLEESFRHSFGTQYFILVYFYPYVCIMIFRIFHDRRVIIQLIWSMFDIHYTRVLNVCEYIQTYSLACPWLLSWPDSLRGDKHRGDKPWNLRVDVCSLAKIGVILVSCSCGKWSPIDADVSQTTSAINH